MSSVQVKNEYVWFRLGMSKVQVRDEYGSCWKDFHSNISLLTSNLSPNLLHSPHEHISLKMLFFHFRLLFFTF